MDAKQFAWLYLVENGKAGCTNAYYGGYELDKEFENFEWQRDYDVFEKIRSAQLGAIKTIGVDWKKTTAPTSDTYSVFNGTFADAGEQECLDGYLILNDGSKQHWIANALEVTNVFEMMAKVSSAEAKFKEYFGEAK